MRRGVWHQCGNNSQNIVEEHLQLGMGAGVILSSRDLTLANSTTRASDYHALGAEVLIDPQFYVPDYSNARLASYPIDSFRASITQLHQISDADLAQFAVSLQEMNEAVEADAVLAPAIVYEAQRPDIVQLNARLFSAAKQVGNNLGIPTYATVVLGRSVSSSNQILDAVLSQVTVLDCDGWYYSFEFEEERIPSPQDAVERCLSAGLTLACTGKPVLHAYAGPMALLSFGFGAQGAAIGHAQNLWQFTRGRWAAPVGQGGGGDAPPRFFSTALWGTIVYPDETGFLTPALRAQIMLTSPFSNQVASNLTWSRWDANKHLLHRIFTTVTPLAALNDAVASANAAITHLQGAVALHHTIATAHILPPLRDNTDAYQENWANAMSDLLVSRSGDYALLALL